MAETKKDEKVEKAVATESKAEEKKPHTTENKEKEQKSATLDERLTQMEDESIKVSNTNITATPEKKAEPKPEAPTDTVKIPTPEPKHEVTTNAVIDVSSDEMNGEKSHKTVIALVAGIIVGALITYLTL